MADVVHDTSDPASSKPGDMDRGKLRVFISYSREDLDFADQLDAALKACGFECVIDRHGISGGEDWKRRLGNLISEADTVVFVLSPDSAVSEICAWEVDEATRLNKRILSVNCRPLKGASPPQRLRDLNYIFFYAEPKAPGSGFGAGLVSLVAALNTDFDWLRKHTRYLQRATEWEMGGRHANRLLSGDDILAAKAWAARRPKSAPEPTTLQLDFIRASEEEAEARSSEQRKQLEAVAAAQAEREKALHQAEEAQRKRATMARVRNIAFVIVSILAVLAGYLYWNAIQQRKTADEQRKVAEAQTKLAEAQKEQADEQRKVAEAQKEQADDILERATNIIVHSYTQMDTETNKLVGALFQAGADHGDAASMSNLGVLYHNGYGVAQDYGKAREWYEKAAAKGEPGAMTNLGVLYYNGYGVAQDYGKAREWFEKAAAKGNARAMYDLGALYYNGYGVAPDRGKAREWYEKAANKDNSEAMTNLGVIYYNGYGVAQDYGKAREWFEKASAKGDARAMFLLGVLYYNGYGVAQDYGKAREWFEKAAGKNNSDAMTELGQFYENGWGVAQDYDKAREWYEKAAAKGDAKAKARLEVLAASRPGKAGTVR